MFTKQDYKAIAEIIKEATQESHNGVVNWVHRGNLIDELADYFAEDNPRFDRKRFVEACRL
jgi:hypothetical protein